MYCIFFAWSTSFTVLHFFQMIQFVDFSLEIQSSSLSHASRIQVSTSLPYSNSYYLQLWTIDLLSICCFLLVIAIFISQFQNVESIQSQNVLFLSCSCLPCEIFLTIRCCLTLPRFPLDPRVTDLSNLPLVFSTPLQSTNAHLFSPSSPFLWCRTLSSSVHFQSAIPVSLTWFHS